jgi:hypothetical protein
LGTVSLFLSTASIVTSRASDIFALVGLIVTSKWSMLAAQAIAILKNTQVRILKNVNFFVVFIFICF